MLVINCADAFPFGHTPAHRQETDPRPTSPGDDFQCPEEAHGDKYDHGDPYDETVVPFKEIDGDHILVDHDEISDALYNAWYNHMVVVQQGLTRAAVRRLSGADQPMDLFTAVHQETAQRVCDLLAATLMERMTLAGIDTLVRSKIVTALITSLGDVF